jgi:heme/copper-type cytochrome/quinol oxidase subunit 3
MAMAALGTPPAAPPRRPRVLVVGTAFAAAATVMAFAGLLGTYLAQRAEALAGGGTWLPDGVTIELTQPTVMFFGLVMSVVTVHWAAQAARNEDRPNLYLAIGLTLVLGIAYVNMTAYLLAQTGLEVDAMAPAVLIFTIVGAHVIMAIVAMVFLGLMGFRALGGQFLGAQHDGIAASALFWDVMVAVYGVIWIVIYVTK